MRFTHENRFIIGLLGLMGFVDAVAPHYQYIHFFNAIMIVWVFYEDLVTLIRNNNVKALNVYAVVVTNFRDVGWDIALLLGIIDGLAVNFYSLKS